MYCPQAFPRCILFSVFLHVLVTILPFQWSLICTVFTSSANLMFAMSFLINRTATQMTSIMNLQTLKTWHMKFGVRTQSFLRWVFLFFCILFQLYWNIFLHWTYLGWWSLQSNDSSSFKGGRKETKEEVWIPIIKFWVIFEFQTKVMSSWFVLWLEDRCHTANEVIGKASNCQEVTMVT